MNYSPMGVYNSNLLIGLEFMNINKYIIMSVKYSFENITKIYLGIKSLNFMFVIILFVQKGNFDYFDHEKN